ncbi:hypothetical protein QQ045_008573 [Rhodiola kirilowii]
MLRLMPRILALMAVQRQTAASRSISPERREQQGASGGVPTTAFTGPSNSLAHTPSFSASLGQPLVVAGGRIGAVGLGMGLGLGLKHVSQQLTSAKKRMFRESNNATEGETLVLMSSFSSTSIYTLRI